MSSTLGFLTALAFVSLFDIPVLGRAGVILLVLLVGLLAALANIVVPVVKRAPDRTGDDRPADGLVPIVRLAGVESEQNPERPEIRKFVREIRDAVGEKTDGRPSKLRLRGRVALFSFFVGRDGSEWTSLEIARAYDSLARMGRWFEKEATRWGAPLNFEAINTYFAALDDHDEIVELEVSLDPFETTIDEANVELRGIASASRAAARIGFADLADLVGRVDRLVDHDVTVWFVHLLRAGRSRAILAAPMSLPGAGLALCYAREASASAPLVGPPYVDPATLTHELLHLFGATDKYGTRLATFPRRSVTARDIMRLDDDRLSRLRIDSLTAWEIGWISSPTLGAKDRPASRHS